ncbi:MAG TPA: rhodanese-like domain-containing protein [Rhodothermales bacterium]|nr:rhodanese-like domain-containing protein [Rhodothermales bacterium]
MLFSSLFRTQSKPKVPRLTPREFLQQKTDDAVLIDVRTPEEFSQGHLREARNIDLAAFRPQVLTQSLDPSQTYYLYCRSGRRSEYGTRILRELGYEAYNIGGYGKLARAGVDAR